MMGEQFGLIRALPCFGIHNIDNISVVGLVSPSNGHWNNRPSNDGLGSVFAVRCFLADSLNCPTTLQCVRRESAINGRSHHSRRVLHISLNQLKEIRQNLLSQPINLEVQGVLA